MNPFPANAMSSFNGFSEPQIRDAFSRISVSKSFRNAPALQRLLQYVTLKTIEGAGDQLKEYTIGVEILGREEGYDPKVQTIVRVEMHRLREQLKEYYASEGSWEEIGIEIPKGQYKPTFSHRTPGRKEAPGTAAGHAEDIIAVPADNAISRTERRQLKQEFLNLLVSHRTVLLSLCFLQVAGSGKTRFPHRRCRYTHLQKIKVRQLWPAWG